MLLIRTLRQRTLKRPIERRSAFYAVPESDAARRDWQLGALNREWRRITQEVPYYRDLVRERRAPERFATLAEFYATAPAVTREMVRSHGDALRSPKASNYTRVTGGSTGQPVQLPAWKSEFGPPRADTWTGRRWYGVEPASKQFLLWGHSHLWGRGLRGRMAALDRMFRDRLLGYRRFSAYDLSPEKMRQAAQEMLRFRPDYLLGYSVALDMFARANAGVRNELRALGLKVVLGAAEAFPADDSTRLLSDLFGCPVAMEYGSVETGLIAHTHPGGGYRVYWHSYLLEVDPRRSPQGGHAVRVTSLYPRCFPLVRYELGDEIETGADVPESVFAFERVLGRCNEYVRLQSGTLVHSEAFTHAVRTFPQVRAYQVAVDATVTLRLVLDDSLAADTERAMRHNLSCIDPALAGVFIVRVPLLERTPAGKTPMIIHRS